MAYSRLEPFGETAADWRSAMLCALVANLLRDKKQPPIEVSRFMLRYEYQAEGDTTSQATVSGVQRARMLREKVRSAHALFLQASN